MPEAVDSQFGTATVDDQWRIRCFEKKVPNPKPIPGKPDQALVSMGNFVFGADVLLAELEEDAHDRDSQHDFGRNILPRLCSRRIYVYDFRQNIIPGADRPTDYWRDVGTVKSYYDATTDSINQEPEE